MMTGADFAQDALEHVAKKAPTADALRAAEKRLAQAVDGIPVATLCLLPSTNEVGALLDALAAYRAALADGGGK